MIHKIPLLPDIQPNLISFDAVSEQFCLLLFCLCQANRLQQMGNDHRTTLGEMCGWKSAAVKQNPAEGRSVLVSLISGVVTSGLVRPQSCFPTELPSPQHTHTLHSPPSTQRAKSFQAVCFSACFFFSFSNQLDLNVELLICLTILILLYKPDAPLNAGLV